MKNIDDTLREAAHRSISKLLADAPEPIAIQLIELKESFCDADRETILELSLRFEELKRILRKAKK